MEKYIKTPSIVLACLALLLILPLSILSQPTTQTELQITTIAGTGTAGFSGDGGLATLAQIKDTRGLAVDSSGNVYIADTNNHRIRKIDTNGIIITIVGTGTRTFSGEGGLATQASLATPSGIALEGSGNLFIADSLNSRIRKIDKATGIITTIAGTATAGFSGDGGLATSSQLTAPSGIVFDSLGSMYIADTGNSRIRKIDKNGIITTVAGNGNSGFSGDWGSATQASLATPYGIAVDKDNNLFIAYSGNNRIRKVDATGKITTVAGTSDGLSGDNGPATSAQLSLPSTIAIDQTGNLFIADTGNSRIRKIDTSGIITTVAGGGTSFGESGSPINAQLNRPHGVAIDKDGNIYISDTSNQRIRKISPVVPSPTPTIIATPTLTPSPTATPTPTEIPSTSPTPTATPIPSPSPTAEIDGTELIHTLAAPEDVNSPFKIVEDAIGNVYIADTVNNRIRKVDTAGKITTIAGTGTAGFSGDDGLAINAQLNKPYGISVKPDGTAIYIADTLNNRIRVIDAFGKITTIAGIGTAGLSGDNGLAPEAQLNRPYGISRDPDGNLYIADTYNHNIRKIDTTGRITTFAGTGVEGFSGDTGKATRATLSFPMGVSIDPSDKNIIYIADTGNNKIRKVDANGKIKTIAGGFIEADILLEAVNFESIGIPETERTESSVKYIIQAQVKNPTTVARQIYLLTYISEPDGSKVLARSGDRTPIEIGAGESKTINLTKKSFSPAGDKVAVKIEVRDVYGNKNSISGIYEVGKVTPIDKPKKYFGTKYGLSLMESGGNTIEKNIIIPWSPVDSSMFLFASGNNKLRSNQIYSRGSGHGIFVQLSNIIEGSNNNSLELNQVSTAGINSNALYIKNSNNINVRSGILESDGSSVLRVNNSRGITLRNVDFKRNSIVFDDASEVEIYKGFNIKVTDATTHQEIQNSVVEVSDSEGAKIVSEKLSTGKKKLDELKESLVRGVRR